VTGGPGDALVGELLARCTFPAPGTPLRAGVSGGADSLALLALAAAAGCAVTAVHVDHGLRPGSAQEAEVVAAAARRFGAGFEARAVRPGPGPNLEARARAVRRAVLGPDASTGHTMDDQAETVLINMLRGAGRDGLAAMRPGPRHPLLGLRRSETHALCAALGLHPVHDPSNEDRRFLRNRVRLELLPLCNALAGRDVVPVLARQAALLAEEADLLEELAARLDATDARALAAAPSVLARRATRRWLRAGAAHPPDLAAVERVLAVAGGARRATEVAPARRVRRSGGRLWAEPAPRPAPRPGREAPGREAPGREAPGRGGGGDRSAPSSAG
jgi:tRNA(Ile)-lysidine synthase